VAKIEELFSELDNGIAALKTAREQLKVYRQAVLKNAFEGKLTAQWRKDNADKLESPEQLLARIQTERETRYQQQLDEWKQAVKHWETNGQQGKKPTRPAKLKQLETVTDADFEKPMNWSIAELAGVSYESILGKMLDKQKNSGLERPYLGNINVRWGQFDLSELKMMKIEDSEVERYSLKIGDLVICEGGEPGRCAIWMGDNEDEMFIQKALHRVRFTPSYLPKFAFFYLSYAVPLERVAKHFTGTTIKHLTGAGLAKVQLPICSVREQEEIISLIEAKLSEVDALDTELKVQLAKAETLRQSILKKAFSGQLVPQDPNDEPASELLARIQAEKTPTQRAKNQLTQPRSNPHE
jgi:type I restriction enzyme S subunit